jgi:protein-disulfide isomerase
MTLSKRDAIKAQRTKKKRQQRMNTILWVGGFIVLLIILLASPTIYNSLKPAGAFVQITPQAYPLEDGKGMGDPKAPVKVVVYEDFQCPSCEGYTSSVEKQLLQSSYITDGQVYYEFKQYPFIDSSSITKESQQAANASMCALEQGRFWDYHDILFANQGAVENGGSFNDKRLVAFAESLSLDMTSFNQCFNDNKYSADIQAEFESGKTAGVTGTPTVLVNGTILPPKYVPTYDQIKSAIDVALAGTGG